MSRPKQLNLFKLTFAGALAAVMTFAFVQLGAPPAAQADPGVCPPELFGCQFHISGVADDGRYCCYYRCPGGGPAPTYCC